MTRKLVLKQQLKVFFALPIVILLAGQMERIFSTFIPMKMILVR